MVQVAGHRAFRGLYPENTMVAFNKAYEAKTDIIETDLQMTRDGVVIVNHDSDTGRMWDANCVIAETDFSEIQLLRNKYDASQRMPTLVDILEWSLEHPDCQLMLDIKFTNDKLILLRTYNDMLKVKNDLDFWRKKIIWGVWLIDWFEFGIEIGIFKSFKVIVITMSLDVAEQFISYSQKLNDPYFKLYGISVHYVASWTKRFREIIVPIVNKYDMKVFLWTVNRKTEFQRMVGLPIFGAVTDNPIKARQYLSENNILIAKGKDQFVIPSYSSIEGLKFHLSVYIYKFVCALLFANWAHKKFCGFSFAYLVFLLLKSIHFF